MSQKSFYILLDMPGDNILGIGTMSDTELHAKVSELLASNKEGVMVYDVEADSAKRASVCYEALSTERLSRRMLIEALLLRNPAAPPALLNVLQPTSNGESKVIPFIEAGAVEKTG
jgi:hypothetical protein